MNDSIPNRLHDWAAVAEQLGGISRSTVYTLWKSGELKSIQIGGTERAGRRFSTDRQIAEYITRLEAEAES